MSSKESTKKKTSKDKTMNQEHEPSTSGVQMPAKLTERSEIEEMKIKLQQQGEALAKLANVPLLLDQIMERLVHGSPEVCEVEVLDENTDNAEDSLDSMNDLIDHDSNQVDKPADTLEELMQDEEDLQEGPPLMEAVAQKIQKFTSDDLSRETMDKFKNRTLIPSNCTTYFAAPRMNPELWSALPMQIKTSDVKAQTNQSMIVKAQSCFALIANEIASHSRSIPKEFCEKVLRWSMDGTAFLASVQKELNIKRRMAVKPYVDPQYSGICTTKVNSDSKLLFGDNLADKMKESKSMSALVKQVGTSRFHPYRNKGNFRGRARYSGGRGMPFRGRPVQQRPQFNRFLRNAPPKQ